jgi:hypothetical protein
MIRLKHHFFAKSDTGKFNSIFADKLAECCVALTAFGVYKAARLL